MVKTMTFIDRKMAVPRRASIQLAAPCSPPDWLTAAANRQPKQQNAGFPSLAGHSLHRGKSVCQVALRVAIHVFVKVVGGEVPQRAVLTPARN